MARVVDLFAGPGGWDHGLAQLGVPDVVGIEWDGDACATAVAAGHARIRADVTCYPTVPFAGVEGVIASPPCPSWSAAGQRAAMVDLERVLAHVDRCRDGWVDYPTSGWADDRTPLILEPLRWVDAVRPRWVACEQVPPCAPVWRRMLHVLEGWGYRGWVAVLNAADYGVPQTRRRALLVATLDGRAPAPEVTHYDPRRGGGLFGEPWVSMAEALGWDGQLDRRTNSKDGHGGMVPTVTVATDRPAPSVTSKGAQGQWVMRNNNQARACEAQFARDAIKVAIWQLGVLQGFPPDYPWTGTKTSRGRQVGNAMPPPLAAAVLEPLVAAPAVAA